MTPRGLEGRHDSSCCRRCFRSRHVDSPGLVPTSRAACCGSCRLRGCLGAHGPQPLQGSRDPTGSISVCVEYAEHAFLDSLELKRPRSDCDAGLADFASRAEGTLSDFEPYPGLGVRATPTARWRCSASLAADWLVARAGEPAIFEYYRLRQSTDDWRGRLRGRLRHHHRRLLHGVRGVPRRRLRALTGKGSMPADAPPGGWPDESPFVAAHFRCADTHSMVPGGLLVMS